MECGAVGEDNLSYNEKDLVCAACSGVDRNAVIVYIQFLIKVHVGFNYVAKSNLTFSTLSKIFNS